jgi:transcriptional regulator with GAF, ATPase, and Fis domain
MHFLERTCQDFGHRPLTLSQRQAALLKEYTWPGNVRELKNVIERAVILSQGKVLRLDLAMSSILDSAPEPAGRDAGTVAQEIMTEDEVRQLERSNLRRALEQTDWRVSGPKGAAKLMGLKPSTLADRIRKYGLTRRSSSAA